MKLIIPALLAILSGLDEVYEAHFVLHGRFRICWRGFLSSRFSASLVIVDTLE